MITLLMRRSFFDTRGSLKDNNRMQPNSEPYFIPSSYSRIIARELGLLERDLPKLLAGTGLAPEILLAGDESRITGEQQLRVMQNARVLGNAPDFGLRMGRQLQPSAHGPIGYVALSSPDLLTALMSLRDFLPIRIPFAYLTVEQDDRWLTCKVDYRLRADATQSRMLLECFVLVLQSLIESFLGRKLTEALIKLNYESPDYAASYGDYIHSLVLFNQEENCLQIPVAMGAELNPSGETDSHAAARSLCARLLEEVPVTSLSMSDRVKRYLLAQPVGSVNEEDVARSLFVSKRTLARRLQREGSGYRQIRDQILATMSSHHLRDSGLSVESIAALLGYHDSANFRRAFRRWHGVSPQEFRQQSKRQ